MRKSCLGGYPVLGITRFILVIFCFTFFIVSCGEEGQGPLYGGSVEVPVDQDGDGVADSSDNCPSTANADQKDTDGDKKGDACDDDIDGDGVLNASDPCPTTKNAKGSGLDINSDGVTDECTDTDKDGIADGVDNCPFVANADQKDSNNNGVGDACANTDSDKDGEMDDVDICPYFCGYPPFPITTKSECMAVNGKTDSDGNGVSDDEQVFIWCVSF